MSAEPPKSEPTPILGVDAKVSEKPSDTKVEKPATNENTTKEENKTISLKEWNELQEKASRYDYIANDNELASKVVDHVKAKTGRIGNQSTNNQPDKQQGAKQVDDSAYRQLQQENEQLARRQARIELELFKRDHPDFDQVKDEMARIVNKYPGIDINDAYSLAKQAKPQLSQGTAKENPATPTAETNRSAGNIAPNTTLADIERRINDPKATPRLDDAIEAAFAGAKLKAAQQE